MAVTRTRYEQRSMLNELQTFLTARGYTDITYTDGYQPEVVIVPPHVTVTFPPSSPKTLQLGRIQGQESLYARTAVVNAYMENEGRASAIVDDIMDFMEFECIEIKNPANVFLGTIQCNNTEGILGQVFPPVLTETKNLRWRGSVTAPVESFYPSL